MQKERVRRQGRPPTMENARGKILDEAAELFAREGFEICAVFDDAPEIVGREVGGHRIRPMKDLEALVREREILLGIVAVPCEAAQDVADRLIDAGVLGLLNFAPTRLDVGDRASVASVDLSSRLERLAFQVSLGLKGSIDAEE